MPVFLPCPVGWNEREFDAGNGHLIPYCEPSGLSQVNPDTLQNISPPNFLPCPAGWMEVFDENTELVTCHPFAEEGPMDCGGIDTIHFPGESGCVRIGTECPEGLWADNLPNNRNIVYVEAGASAGDGSDLAPFGSISDALEYAGTGDIIALSKGTFDESVVLPRGIVLWGACVAETVVTSSSINEQEAVITSRFSDTEVRNLQITGQKWGVALSGNDASVHLEGVVVNSTHVLAILVELGSATLKNVIIRDTKSSQSDEKWGIGIIVQNGASVEVSRSVVTNNRDIGIYVSGSTTQLKLDGVLVNNTQSRKSDGMFGRGFLIKQGASVEVNRSVVTNNIHQGILVIGSNTQLKMRDVLINNTQSRKSDGMFGRGLQVQEGASADVSHSVFANNRDIGIFACNNNTQVKLQDVLVKNTQSRKSDGIGGRGLSVDTGASVAVSRSIFTNNREIGVIANGSNTYLELQDVLVKNTQSQERDGMFGRGLVIQFGAFAEVSRSVFTKNRYIGVHAAGSTTHVTLQDVLINDTQSQEKNHLGGIGLGIFLGASMEVYRSILINNSDIGAFASDDNTHLELQNVLVKNSQRQKNYEMWGRGLNIQNGASVEVFRSVLTNNRDIGVSAYESNTDVKLHDVIVAHTLELECPDSTVSTRTQSLSFNTRNITPVFRCKR